MLELSRTVRFIVEEGEALEADSIGIANGHAGWPPMASLGAFYELTVCCTGEPDEQTGYLINIKEIDQAVRRTSVPAFRTNLASSRPSPSALLSQVTNRLKDELPVSITSVRLALSPTYTLSMDAQNMTHVLMTQEFDFSAAHRLHMESLSAAENLRVFGKCNNPHGHGHNYRIEPAVRISIDQDPPGFTLAMLESLTERLIIDRFDHKHLNLDTAEFAMGSGLNPTVENIARVCYEILGPAVRDESSGQAELAHVTVWETDRTRCRYPAES